MTVLACAHILILTHNDQRWSAFEEMCQTQDYRIHFGSENWARYDIYDLIICEDPAYISNIPPALCPPLIILGVTERREGYLCRYIDPTTPDTAIFKLTSDILTLSRRALYYQAHTKTSLPFLPFDSNEIKSAYILDPNPGEVAALDLAFNGNIDITVGQGDEPNSALSDYDLILMPYTDQQSHLSQGHQTILYIATDQEAVKDRFASQVLRRPYRPKDLKSKIINVTSDSQIIRSYETYLESYRNAQNRSQINHTKDEATQHAISNWLKLIQDRHLNCCGIYLSWKTSEPIDQTGLSTYLVSEVLGVLESVFTIDQSFLRLSEQSIIILCPRTDERQGKTALNQIIGILNHTSFNDLNTKVDFVGGFTSFCDNDTPDEFMQRAQKLKGIQ